MPALSERIVNAARPTAVIAATAAWVVSVVVNDLSGWWFVLTTAAGL
ncbi:MAG: hypothetical protein K0R87_1792, partial [Pseudonocardia sp.]|nr:hypothetical protein [Pseudonocardia sp.]